MYLSLLLLPVLDMMKIRKRADFYSIKMEAKNQKLDQTSERLGQRMGQKLGQRLSQRLVRG